MHIFVSSGFSSFRIDILFLNSSHLQFQRVSPPSSLFWPEVDDVERLLSIPYLVIRNNTYTSSFIKIGWKLWLWQCHMWVFFDEDGGRDVINMLISWIINDQTPNLKLIVRGKIYFDWLNRLKPKTVIKIYHFQLFKNGPQVNGSETVIFTPNSLNLCMLITKWLNDTHTTFQVNRSTNKRFMGCWSAKTVLGVLWFGRRFAQNASRLQVKLDWYCAAKHFPFDQFVWNFARICFRDLTIKLHIFYWFDPTETVFNRYHC